MRLTSLTLINYGIFRSQRIGFDAAPGRINLLIAPNGAGKSILRNAFCDLLFGIHGQTQMGFRFGYGGMRLEAEAVSPDGSPFVFGRRKGQGNTLIGADGMPTNSGALARLLGYTDRALLERLFALDTERLRKGGEELLASEGAVADALLSAAGGLRRARQIRPSLDAARDALAPVRKAQQRPFYAALERFVDARRRLGVAVLKPETRAKQETELAHLQAEQERCNKIAAAASTHIARLERIRRVIGIVAERDDAVAWLARQPDAPVLPTDAKERLANARADLLRAEQLLERDRRNRDAIAEQVEKISFDAGLIEHAEAIEKLIERAGAARQADTDIPKREAEHAVKAARVAAILRQLGSALTVESAAGAIPPRAAMLRARALFTEHEKLRSELERLPSELADTDAEMAETEAAMARLPPSVDTRGLGRLVREIRAGGDPDEYAQELGRAVTETRANLAAALSRVPGWNSGTEALIALNVLSIETYERLHAARAETEAAWQGTAQELARLRRSAEVEKLRLAEIAAGEPIPDAFAIAADRERRDGGWRLIYRRAFTAEPPAPDAERAWAGDIPLPLAYERSVAAADALADRRNQEAERLAQAAELTRLIAAAEIRVNEAEDLRAAAASRCGQALADWRGACAGFSMSVELTIIEIRALLSARERAIEARRELDSALERKAVLEKRHAEWAGRLAAELEQPASQRERALSQLLALAEERLEAAQQADGERGQLQGRLGAQRKARDGIAADRHAAERRSAALRDGWTELREELGRPAAEDPSITVDLLDLIAELDKEQQAAADLRHRLRQMQDDLAAFRRAAADLAARVAPDLAEAGAFEAVQHLQQRLTGHRAQANKRAALLKELQRAGGDLARQQAQLEQCRIEMGTVLALIGAETVEVAEARVELAAERARTEEAVRRTERELREKGDGRTLDDLRTEVASVPIDEVPDRIRRAQSEHDEAFQEAQTLAGHIAKAQAEMDAQAGETAVSQATVDQQAAIATLGRVLEDAVLMQVASLLLETSLAEVEATGTSVLLARIGDLFRTITGGAYQRILAEDTGDGPARLIAVLREFPDEPKSVGELSEGERDQLFLALRLAAIEEHVATASTLPFVGDDILQTFDDDRAAAAMQALVQLSESVQIILLSHHHHLLALAKRLAPRQVHICEMSRSLAG